MCVPQSEYRAALTQWTNEVTPSASDAESLQDQPTKPPPPKIPKASCNKKKGMASRKEKLAPAKLDFPERKVVKTQQLSNGMNYET